MIIVIFFLIIIPILIYLPSPIGIIPQEEAGNVLGFYGTVLGGIMTLGGVAWTICDQNNKRTANYALEFRPFLSIKSLHDRNFCLRGNMTLCFQIKNIGRGEFIDLKLNCEVKINNITILKSEIINNSYEFLTINQEEICEISFPIPEKYLKADIADIDVIFTPSGKNLFYNNITIPQIKKFFETKYDHIIDNHRIYRRLTRT